MAKMEIIDKGFRGEQPVGLIKRVFNNDYEYVIAFNYEEQDNKINWGYGYYYGKDIDKATEDFKKVLSGGNLFHTFDKNKKDKER